MLRCGVTAYAPKAPALGLLRRQAASTAPLRVATLAALGRNPVARPNRIRPAAKNLSSSDISGQRKLVVAVPRLPKTVPTFDPVSSRIDPRNTKAVSPLWVGLPNRRTGGGGGGGGRLALALALSARRAAAKGLPPREATRRTAKAVVSAVASLAANRSRGARCHRLRASAELRRPARLARRRRRPSLDGAVGDNSETSGQ